MLDDILASTADWCAQRRTSDRSTLGTKSNRRRDYDFRWLLYRCCLSQRPLGGPDMSVRGYRAAPCLQPNHFDTFATHQRRGGTQISIREPARQQSEEKDSSDDQCKGPTQEEDKPWPRRPGNPYGCNHGDSTHREDRGADNRWQRKGIRGCTGKSGNITWQTNEVAFLSVVEVIENQSSDCSDQVEKRAACPEDHHEEAAELERADPDNEWNGAEAERVHEAVKLNAELCFDRRPAEEPSK